MTSMCQQLPFVLCVDVIQAKTDFQLNAVIEKLND